VTHLERAEVGGEPAKVALERLDEQGPVAALQSELAELEQHAALSANVLHMARIYRRGPSTGRCPVRRHSVLLVEGFTGELGAAGAEQVHLHVVARVGVE